MNETEGGQPWGNLRCPTLGLTCFVLMFTSLHRISPDFLNT